MNYNPQSWISKNNIKFKKLLNVGNFQVNDFYLFKKIVYLRISSVQKFIYLKLYLKIRVQFFYV